MLKQIFLVNTNLKMEKGKIAVQVAHGEVIYMESLPNSMDYPDERLDRYGEWRSNSKEDPIGMMKKVVLKSTESEIRDYYIRLKSQNIWTYMIFDKGLTQIPENSLTCLVVEPLEESICDTLFGDLKLL